VTRVDDLHKKWLKERPGYAKAYAELEDEFQLASEFIAARAPLTLRRRNWPLAWARPVPSSRVSRAAA
jgi:hypothetical protein